MMKFSFSALLASSLVVAFCLSSAVVHGQNMTEAPTIAGPCGVEGAKTVADIACSEDEDSKYKLFCKAAKAAGLDGALAHHNLDGTVWAPNDEAFGRLENFDTLLEPGSQADLTHIMLLHISGPGVGQLGTEDLVCKKSLRTSAEKFTRTQCKQAIKPSYYQVGGNTKKDDNLPKYLTTDIKVCNGIIHEISNVILPPKKKKRKNSKAPTSISI